MDSSDVYKRAITKIKKTDIKINEEIEESHDLLSRDQILKRIKTITATVKDCQQQRLNTFFSPVALESMMEPEGPTKIRREQRHSSQYVSFKTLDLNANASENSQVDDHSSSLSSDTDSYESEIPIIQQFPRITLRFENYFQELESSNNDFDMLDTEFIEKYRFKVKMRTSQSILQGDVSIFSQTGCRSYVKMMIEAYEGDEIELSRNFISISLEGLQVFPSARERVPIFRLNISDVKEIIDPKDGKLRVIYINNDLDKGMIIVPITSADYLK